METPGEKDYKRFLERYRIDDAALTDEKRRFVKIAVAEWSHQRRAGGRARNGFAFAQFVAPIAAATATVLAAFKSTSAWAVIPSAAATVAATLLAAFGLREIWIIRRRLRHELGQEVVEFVMGAGEYRKLDLSKQIDRLMGKIRQITMASAGTGATTEAGASGEAR